LDRGKKLGGLRFMEILLGGDDFPNRRPPS
jgi:hypothetical protein